MQNTVVSYLMCNMKIFYMLDFFFFILRTRSVVLMPLNTRRRDILLFYLKVALVIWNKPLGSWWKPRDWGFPHNKNRTEGSFLSSHMLNSNTSLFFTLDELGSISVAFGNSFVGCVFRIVRSSDQCSSLVGQHGSPVLYISCSHSQGWAENKFSCTFLTNSSIQRKHALPNPASHFFIFL